MVRRILPLILLTLAAGCLYGQAGDGLIGRVWLQRAVELLDESGVTDWDSIEEALEASREYGERGSDSLYVEASLLLAGKKIGSDRDEGSEIRRAYELLGLSLDMLAGGDLVSFMDKAILWSRTALRLREYRAIRERYSHWPLGHRYEPVLLYAAARASLYMGFNEEAAQLARKGESLSRQGEGTSASTTDLSVLSSAFDGPALTRFRALAVAAGDDKAIESLPSALGSWGVSMENALIPWILSGYIDTENTGFPSGSFAPGIDDLRSFLAGGTTRIPGQYANDLALLKRIESRGGNPVLADGEYSSDSDYDGYIEEQIIIRNGQPDTRSLDSDQDGTREWHITYQDGFPIHVIADGGSFSVTYKSGSTPEIFSMVSRQHQTTVTVYFIPGLYSWDPMDGDYLWNEPVGRPILDSSFWESASRAVARHEFPAGYDFAPESGMGATVGEAVTFFADGYPVLAREFRYADTEASVLLWARELLYEEGLEVAGRRSFRIAGDSSERLWELYERYEAGRMVGLAWDPGMTGSPAYLADWALERVLEVQAWDVDRDGWIDYRRFVLPYGETDGAELMITEAVSSDLLPWTVSEWYPWDK